MKNNLLQKNIPKEWENSTLESLVDIYNGKTPLRSKGEFWDEGVISWFTIEDLRRQGREINNTSQKITHEAIKKTGIKILPKNTVLICCTASVGECAFSNIELATNQQFNGLVVKNTKILNEKFLYYLISSLSVHIKSLAGTTTFGFVSIGKLGSVKVLVPTIFEQKKIAEILSSVDEEIQKVDELILKTEKLKKSLTIKFFNESKVKKFINFSDLVSLSKSKIDPKNSSEEKYIGLEHIEQETSRLIGVGNSLDTTSIKSSFKKGDILFGKLRPYLRKYWKAEFDGVCTTEIFVFEPKNKDDTDFIFQIVQSEAFVEHSNSKSFGTKMPRTDWKIVSTFKVPDFSTEEKRKIGIILSEIDRKNLIHRKLKEKLVLLKKGLMSDLLSGKVRVIK